MYCTDTLRLSIDSKKWLGEQIKQKRGRLHTHADLSVVSVYPRHWSLVRVRTRLDALRSSEPTQWTSLESVRVVYTTTAVPYSPCMYVLPCIPPPLNPSGSAEGGADGRFECCFWFALTFTRELCLTQSREDDRITFVISLIVHF